MLHENHNQDTAGNTVVSGIGTAGNVPIEGSISVSNTPDVHVTNVPDVHVTNTPSVKGAGTAGSPDAGVLTIQGISGGQAIPVSMAAASSAVISQVAQSVVSVSLLAVNANRKGIILWNAGTKPAYIAFAATASASAFTILLAMNSSYESEVNYTGAVSALWQGAGGGSMQVTELS